MLDIKKVRYVRSALGGAPLLSSSLPFDLAKAVLEYSFNSQIPTNPYMTTDGLAKPEPLMPPLSGKPVGSIAKSIDMKVLNKDLQKISTNVSLAAPKLNFFLNPNNVGYLNLGLGLANDMLFSGEENSGLTNGINQGWDAAAGAVGAINPLFGAAMKGISLAGNSLKSIGGGTDQMTTTDLVFDSSPVTFLTMGLNGFLGKNTLDFSVNKLTVELVGGSYGGSVKNINDVASKAGKKYGLFSSGSRKETDKLIGTARGLLGTMTGIANEASDMFSVASNMSLLNHMNYGFNLNGGYDQRYMRAAKIGGKLDRIKKLNLSKFKVGGTISGTVNLETKEIEWVPIITEPIEIYEDGGKIWTPIITEPIELFEEGGKTKELDDSKIEETSQKNVIPEGALHARKHHMENADGLTEKGIPVIDNDREQLAEIELNEIIFTLEVTKKLEELQKDGSDDAAIEAGKLLVELILFNTDDRTGLISTLKLGGQLKNK